MSVLNKAMMDSLEKLQRSVVVDSGDYIIGIDTLKIMGCGGAGCCAPGSACANACSGGCKGSCTRSCQGRLR